MGLYDVPGLHGWLILIVVLFGLMAFNELSRTTRWGGVVLFIILPILLTIFVWPKTAAMDNEHGTGYWFTWVKTYSALTGCIGFMAIRYTPSLAKKKWVLLFPPLILSINILEACVRDFQVYSYGAWQGEYIDHLWMMSGSWNILNGIAGILNILTICGWAGIYISKDKTKDMIWPDMIWAWIIAYDVWNFAYTYNCLADRSFYCGLTLLLSCTIPAFFTKRGAWLQHRAATLSLWAMFVMTVPEFNTQMAPVHSTRSPKALFIVSILAFVLNLALFVFQTIRIRRHKLNPLKDELYTETKAYKSVVAETA